MEIKKLDWKTFVGRKRLQVSKWLEKNNISKYSDLVKKCISKDIVPPTKEEVPELQKKKQPKKVEVVKEPEKDEMVESPKQKEKDEETKEEKNSKKSSKKKTTKKSSSKKLSTTIEDSEES